MYVKFQNVYLNQLLAEIRNVALNKVAWSSSRDGVRYPGRAVDGRVLETDDNKCVTTQSEISPWWKVNLQDVYRIHRIVISTSGKKSGYFSLL